MIETRSFVAMFTLFQLACHVDWNQLLPSVALQPHELEASVKTDTAGGLLMLVARRDKQFHCLMNMCHYSTSAQNSWFRRIQWFTQGSEWAVSSILQMMVLPGATTLEA